VYALPQQNVSPTYHRPRLAALAEEDADLANDGNACFVSPVQTE
jgi:hypothetical protein